MKSRTGVLNKTQLNKISRFFDRKNVRDFFRFFFVKAGLETFNPIFILILDLIFFGWKVQESSELKICCNDYVTREHTQILKYFLSYAEEISP